MSLKDLAGVALNAESIGRDAACHHCFPQAPGGFDEHAVAVRIERIARKEYSGALGGHESLNDDGHVHFADALTLAIGLRPV